MSDKKLREFEISVEYYKPSGKLYVREKFTASFQDIGPEGHPSCYMYDVVDAVIYMRLQGKLPGLASGRWQGPIRVDCEHGYPHLIPGTST